MFDALASRPAERGVDNKETLDEAPGILGHIAEVRMIEVHIAGDNILLQLDRVPEHDDDNAMISMQ